MNRKTCVSYVWRLNKGMKILGLNNYKHSNLRMLFTKKKHEIDNHELFSALELRSFTETEISESFEKLRKRNKFGEFRIQEARYLVIQSTRGPLTENEIALKAEFLMKKLGGDKSGVVSSTEFNKSVRKEAATLDPRIWTVALSFVSSGVTLGIVTPCMPLLVQELGIPPSDFGFVISSFALARLLGNIPSAYFVDKLGRKPLMVAGLACCSAGLGGISLSLIPGFGTPWLIGCRLLTGLGVSLYSTGAYMFMTDVSTPLNRTRTISPLLASFNAGTALGPAIGGALVGYAGIPAAYLTVGSMFAVFSALNRVMLVETKPIPRPSLRPVQDPDSRVSSDSSSSPSGPPLPTHVTSQGPHAKGSIWRGLRNSFAASYTSWKRLFQLREVRDLVIFNTVCTTFTSGSQYTMLPLLLVGSTFSLSAMEMGGAFAFISAVSVLSSQPVAVLADSWGKIPVIVSGTLLIASSFVGLPFASNISELGMLLVPLSLGTTALAAVPTAYITDLVPVVDRAQVLSLLRTTSDIGFFVGASSAGILAGLTSVDHVLEGSALGLTMASSIFGLKWWLSRVGTP